MPLFPLTIPISLSSPNQETLSPCNGQSTNPLPLIPLLAPGWSSSLVLSQKYKTGDGHLPAGSEEQEESLARRAAGVSNATQLRPYTEVKTLAAAAAHATGFATCASFVAHVP